MREKIQQIVLENYYEINYFNLKANIKNSIVTLEDCKHLSFLRK